MVQNWYKDFFNGIALEFWKKIIPPRYTEVESFFLAGELSQGGHILDIPCGFGRHAIELARHGFTVTGVDFSEEYVKELSAESAKGNLPVKAIVGDMLDINLGEVFDGAICFGNSFSYFPYEGMVKFVSNVARHLREDAKFIINTGMLAESVLPNLHEREWAIVDDITFLMENVYQVHPARVETSYIFIKDGKQERKTAIHFVYTLSEVERILSQSGFSIVDVCGSIEANAPFGFKDPQAYIIAEKNGNPES